MFAFGYLVALNTWADVVFRYEASTRQITFWLYNQKPYKQFTCPVNSVVDFTFGKATIGYGVDVVGAFVVDIFMSDAEVVLVQNSIIAGDDLLQQGHPVPCQICVAGTYRDYTSATTVAACTSCTPSFGKRS